MRPEYQWLITIIGFSITIYGFYNVLRARSVEQATKINTLELKVEFLERNIENNTRRLDDHEKQYKILSKLVVQVENLTERVKEVQTTIKEEIKNGQ